MPGSTWTPSARQRERERYWRSRTRRSWLIALASSVVLVVLLGFGIVNSPGWPRIQATFFDPQVALDSLPDVMAGMWLNVRVWLAGSVLMMVFGLIIAILRTLRGPVFWPVRALATGYVDLFRGMPVIIVLFVIGFGLPGLRLQGIPTGPGILGTVALTLTYSAYVAEVLRAGIESIHPSQRAAARSLGLSTTQTLRHVVLPQAVRRVVPPLLNDVISLQKDAGLISVLGALDALRYAQIATADEASFTPYLVAGLLFVAISVPLTRITDALARRQGYTFQGGRL
ncbi:MAG: amino acid ABC transporter permease [Kineosporiaceae bacterium]|nr:amino acid ABC transporter permease [Kineosporiaceae bacterium]MBK7624066.1 amino acid ABC transporter permease [Kineosporiaceae bacterium]MBK8075821.1 amino acid ABC transporter permease [Kineosporiaceae bacterium]